MVIKRFSFCILTYNHENYIIEHLESIKYLICNYGRGITIQIIINDDCSTDATRCLIDKWIDINSNLFSDVIKLYNEKNIGTCQSVLNIFSKVEAEYFKLTAGDDVYSFENLFTIAPLTDSFALVSGIPLDLTDSILSEKKQDIFNIIASYIIYKDRPMLERFKGLSNNNAPNLFYSKRFLNYKVCSFVSMFKLVEDWPLQIAIAKNYPLEKFSLVKKVLVYYRRTSGSIFIIANNIFLDDKSRIFRWLIEDEKSILRKIILKNRLFCLLVKNNFYRRILNISLYFYVLKFILNIFKIKTEMATFDSKLDEHKKHYQSINYLSKKFIDENYRTDNDAR